MRLDFSLLLGQRFQSRFLVNRLNRGGGHLGLGRSHGMPAALDEEIDQDAKQKGRKEN
jgi:hypothetical protein